MSNWFVQGAVKHSKVVSIASGPWIQISGCNRHVRAHCASDVCGFLHGHPRPKWFSDMEWCNGIFLGVDGLSVEVVGPMDHNKVQLDDVKSQQARAALRKLLK
jgi:hypothetical protein